MISTNSPKFSYFYLLLLTIILFNISWTVGLPLLKETQTKRLSPRQVNFVRNPDGSITATISESQAIDIPGQGSSTFGLAETINIGPMGTSIDGGQSFTSDFGGNRVAFGQTNSQNSRQGPHGFENSGSNSASNSFQNPFFQSSNANANAFNNQFNQNPTNGFNQFNHAPNRGFGQGFF